MDYYSLIEMSHKNTWNKFKYIFLSERSPSEKATYWMLPTMWQSGKCINMEIMKRLAQKLRREDQQAKQREFGGIETTLYITILEGICCYTFVQTEEYIIPWMIPTEKYGLWMIMMDKYKFIKCNNIPLWWGFW